MKVIQRAPQSVCQRSFAAPRSPAFQSRSRDSVVSRCAPESKEVGVERQGQNFAPAKDIDAIMKALPHRSVPFVLVLSCCSPLFNLFPVATVDGKVHALYILDYYIYLTACMVYGFQLLLCAHGRTLPCSTDCMPEQPLPAGPKGTDKSLKLWYIKIYLAL